MQAPRTLSLALLAAAFLTGILHIAGAFLHWYDANAWYDAIVHAAGGGWVAFAFLWTIRRTGHTAPLWSTLFAVLAVGGAWELFEVWARVPRETSYIFDTITDFAVGLFGGTFAFLFARRIDSTRAEE
jgi:hypothetical protein